MAFLNRNVFSIESTAIVLLCVVLSKGAVTSESVFDDSLLKIPHTSYLDVLNGLSSTLNHVGNEKYQYGVKNASVNIFQLYNRVYKFVFNEDEQDARKMRKVLTSFADVGKRDEVMRHIRKQYKGNDDVPPDILASFDKFKAVEGSSNAPSTCISDTGRILVALTNKEPWAIQFLDAAGKPGPSLTEIRVNFAGNYDQCRAAIATPRPEDASRADAGKFQGKYGVIVVKTPSIPLEGKLGVCFPDTCSDMEITILTYQIFALQKKIPLQYAYFLDLTVRTEMTPAAKAAISILTIIGFLIVTGTLYDLLLQPRPNPPKPKSTLVTNMNSVDASSHPPNSARQANSHRTTSNGEKTPLLPTTDQNNAKENIQLQPVSNTIVAQILLSFSVYSNGKKVLNTSQAEGSLGSIHGIRFLSMSWVVLCHTFAFSPQFALNYFSAFSEFAQRWSFVVISNGFVSVDTFFTLSGLLTSYLTVKEMTRRNTWKINWPLFYFHRFWRLTPPYMFALVIALGLTQYMGQGAMWSNQQPYDRKFCEDNWWTNLLYVNNLVKLDKACFGHSWYLANDMQFFVLSPLMMIPFFFHRVAGFFSCSVFLLASWITTGVLSHDRKWPTTTMSLKPVPGRAGNEAWMEDYYVVPWCRIGPFIVGIMAGYILAVTKGRQFKMPKWAVVTGWVVSLTTGLAIVYGLYGDIKGDHPSSLRAAAFYNAVNRSAWGACVSWVIIACSAGYGGPVNTLLSWSPFVVLGRLTYMSYLIHICIVYTFFGNLDTPFSMNDTIIVVYFLGLLVFVNLAAFVGVLVLESPMLGLEKAILKRGKKD